MGERYSADLPVPGREPGEPCEAGCGVRTFTARPLSGGRPVLIETVPGRPLSFGEVHTRERCAVSARSTSESEAPDE